MKISLIDKVIPSLDSVISKKTEMLAFPDSGSIPVKIDKENFHQLELFSSDKELIAVDGGITTILNTSSFSLHFIRVVAVTYKENKRTDIIKKEFFCLVNSETKEDMIYTVQIFGDNLFSTPLAFNSKLEGEILENSQVGDIVRRHAELQLATNIIKKKNVFVIIDGSAKAKTNEELELITKLNNKAKESNNTIGFLSKTCTLLTKNGNSLNTTLHELGPKSSWYYYPVFKESNLYFVKLHSKSNYVFKLEIDSNASDFILALAMNSKDSIFYGYPYCLIDADRQARVTNKEKDYLRAIFLSKIKSKEKLRYLLSTLDAHDILDRIS